MTNLILSMLMTSVTRFPGISIYVGPGLPYILHLTAYENNFYNMRYLPLSLFLHVFNILLCTFSMRKGIDSNVSILAENLVQL